MNVKKSTMSARYFFTFLFLFPANICWAALSPSLNYAYDTVIVTAKRVAVPKARTAENIIIYTEEDLKQLPARNLNEVLKYIPGVDTKVTTEFGQGSSLSINGSPSRQVLLMVDGIPFNTQISGQANPTRISIEQIKQIEVIKGASSSAWGSSLGGVINVITKEVGDTVIPQGELTTAWAEFETVRKALELKGRLAQIRYFFSGSFMDTEGPLAETDAHEKRGFGKVSYDLGEIGKITGSFGYSGADVLFGVTPTNRINATPYQTRYGQLVFERGEDNVHFNLAYKYNDQDITTDIYNATTKSLVSSTVSHNLFQGLSFVTDVELFDDDSFVAGADFSWHTLKSNNFLKESKSINMQAPFMNYTWTVGNFDIIPGVRYDHNQHFGSQTSPSLGAIYHFFDENESLIRVKVSRAFNAPPLLWIFNYDPVLSVGPNPDLEAERAIVYEAGFETKIIPTVSLEVNVYQSDVKDALGLAFENGLFIQKNFEEFRRRGIEILLREKISKYFTLYVSGGFNDVEDRATGRLVRDQGIARQRFTFGGIFNKNGYGVHLSGYYNRWSSSPSLRANDRKPIFDLKLSKDFDGIYKDIDLEAFYAIHNITNSKYWSDITFPLPRRYFEGGITLKF